MTDGIPLSNSTKLAVANYLKDPVQSIGLIGPKFSNQTAIINKLAHSVLGLNNTELITYPYILRTSTDNKTIGIDDVRQISSFLSLKVPIKAKINRLIIIEDANKMSIEAQNALLKNLEEPPIGTVFIISAPNYTSLLPTVLSRLTTIELLNPSKEALTKYYLAQGYSKNNIEQSFLITGGLPELMKDMLDQSEHPLNIATELARSILSSNIFDRLNKVNELAKDKNQFRDVIFVIKQMSKIGLNSNDQKNREKWQKILMSCTTTLDKLNANSQAKLVITNFMLSIA
jgi:DNA polymerase-3 subunit delta'